MLEYLFWASVAAAFISAGCWFRAATVNISRDAVVRQRRRVAHRKGIQPDLSGVSLDGNDLSGTFKAQAFWNALGALSAGVAILLQTVDRMA